MSYFTKFEAAEDAGSEFYIKFANALHVPVEGKRTYDWFWFSLDITYKDGVIRVYWQNQLIFTELEDRFPSEKNLTVFRLMALI